jgi:acetoin utilization deacetylase AcuC-like enzyme
VSPVNPCDNDGVGLLAGAVVRSWKRRLHRLWFRLHARGVPVVYDSRYEKNVWGVPLDPLRGEKVLAAQREAGLLRRDSLSDPRPASLQNLLRVHTAEYLQSLQEGEALTRILGVEVRPSEAEATVELQRLIVGGTIQAARLALKSGGIAMHLGGGFHHALAHTGHGFCVFNDVAVAIRRLRARGYEERILVVDLDLHDGNGTRLLFADDATVHTFSIHNEHWSRTEAVESTAIALGPDVEDMPYLARLRETLPPVFDSFRPGLVFYLAGTDPAADDALGNWRLSPDGIRERDRLVTRLAREQGLSVPMVVLIAGGYGRSAWRHTSRFLLWLASGRDVEPIPDEELTLRRARTLTRAVRTEDDANFTLTDEDLAGLAPGLPPTSRFLGVLSRHGVELLLERLGILDQIRTKGFRNLRVDVTVDGRGDTLRVVSEDAPGELLVELRVTRSRRLIPDMEVVAIEWLLLQNPRGSFSPKRPRLPGQQYPGLGLLRDILGWLVALCEAHELDGVHFVAAHYHIAMQSRRLLRFLRPEDAARADALAAALEGLSLAEAAQALVSGDAVRDQAGHAVAWEPAPMVLPTSPRLTALVSGPEYEAQVAAAAEDLRFHLVREVV